VCGLTCREILDELTAKLETKLRFSEAHLAETLADLLSFLGVVEISGELRVIAADPADDKILETAVNARATHVVTGDRRHLLPLQADHGIAIVTPRELLTLLGQQPRGSLV
jgi:putative PIN family toxin of toxin-antitoxin system